MDLIELAKKNEIHILFALHTTHILQPLVVGVTSSFKARIEKALNALLRSLPATDNYYPKCGQGH